MAAASGDADVAVVGGGIGGLVAAYELTRAGMRPVVFEAFRWPGGVVGRHTVAGLTLDAGAESYAIANGAVEELIADLGATARISRPNPVGAWVRFDGGAGPLPVGGVLGIPGDPLAPDVVAILGPEGAARAAADRDLDPQVGIEPEGVTTLGGLVRARMGDLVVTRLVEPVVGGVHSADPDGLDIDVITPLLRAALARAGSLAGAVAEMRGAAGRAGSAVGSLEGGLYTLVDLLVRAITYAGGRVESGTPVTAIAPLASGWSVSAGGRATEARALVLAAPPRDLAPLVEPFDAATAALLAKAPSARVRLVTLVVDAPELDAAPRGTGILVSAHCGDEVRAKAMTHATIKWPWLAAAAGPGRHVLRLSYGRDDGEGMPEPAEAPAVALADASTLTGIYLTGSLVESSVITWSQGMPRADAQHAERVRATRALVGRFDRIDLVGAFGAGTGLAAIVADARTRAARLAAEL